jgi:hypothetical protein
MESYLVIILLSIIILYKYFNQSEVTYQEFNNNGIKKIYLVREMPDKDDAVKILGKLDITLKDLVKTLVKDNSIDIEMLGYIKAIVNKIDSVVIQESSADSKYTSYSVNKGEILVFCLRSKRSYKIHDFNDLLYVAIHEIAHIGCPELGHTPLFFKINKFLINKAIEKGIYKYIDYSKNIKEYCGIDLTVTVADNIY